VFWPFYWGFCKNCAKAGLGNCYPEASRRQKGSGQQLLRCLLSAKGVWSTVDKGAFADKDDLVSRFQTILAAATQPGQRSGTNLGPIRVPDALSQDGPFENLHPATPSGISPGAESCPDNVADGSAACVVGRFFGKFQQVTLLMVTAQLSTWLPCFISPLVNCASLSSKSHSTENSDEPSINYLNGAALFRLRRKRGTCLNLGTSTPCFRRYAPLVRVQGGLYAV
jgi:hypothetical protein